MKIFLKLTIKRSIIGLAAISSIVLLASIITSYSFAATTNEQQTRAAPIFTESVLVYVETDVLGHSGAIMQGPHNDPIELADSTAHRSPLAAVSASGPCIVSGLDAAPRGTWIAIQHDCESGCFVQIIDSTTGAIQDFDTNLDAANSQFLGWSSTGDEVLVKINRYSSPRVYQIEVSSGEAVQLPVPTSTYHVAISPSGTQMLYSLTRGLGFGSQTWIADVDGKNASLVSKAPAHIVAFAQWSSTGEKIAYIRMADSNVPFMVGELWVMDSDGSNPILLNSEADAGHGYAPDWSPDGTRIAFVVRENKDDIRADQWPGNLHSNIYIAHVKAGTVSAVTQFDRALTENPVWSSDGQFLAFSSNAGGGMDVWSYDMQGESLVQVTHGANARYPAWLPIPPAP